MASLRGNKAAAAAGEQWQEAWSAVRQQLFHTMPVLVQDGQHGTRTAAAAASADRRASSASKSGILKVLCHGLCPCTAGTCANRMADIMEYVCLASISDASACLHGLLLLLWTPNR
jgi:hypothetical protein